MRYKHFYTQVADSLRDNEDEAWRLWTSTFRRGSSALQYKRYQAAEIYLGAAFDIGLLRAECVNKLFTAQQIVQPVELLTGLYLLQGNLVSARNFFNEARNLLKGVELTDAQERVLQELAQRLTHTQRNRAPAPKPEPAVSELQMPAVVIHDVQRARQIPRRISHSVVSH